VYAAAIDRDGDTASDFWQAYYQIPNLTGTEDADGDGVNNGNEEAAGTNPLDPTSRFHVQEVRIVHRDNLPAGAVLIFPGLAGKTYHLEGSDSFARDGWQRVGTPILATNNSRIEWEVALEPARQGRFLRLAVLDRDEDNDGLTAFEEAIIGTSDGNPNPGNDAAAGLEWLESNEPGINPDAPIANLYEVDVAWVRQPDSREGVAALLVTAVGTGGWHQLTSWQVPRRVFQRRSAPRPLSMDTIPGSRSWSLIASLPKPPRNSLPVAFAIMEIFGYRAARCPRKAALFTTALSVMGKTPM
jgi:hypothetical protein